MKVFIATPTAGGIAKIEYAQTLVAASKAIAAAGGSYDLTSFDSANLVLARNLLTHLFMRDASYTHLLFIDSDMAIEEAVFRQIIAANAPIIGAIYPERRLDLSRFAEAMAEEDNIPRAQALASAYTGAVESGALKVKNNICKINVMGMGCALIARAVFERLSETPPFICPKLGAMGMSGEMRDYFAEARMPDTSFLSQDIAFCERVRAAGQDILGYVGPGVGHVGQFTFSGPFIERLKTGRG